MSAAGFKQLADLFFENAKKNPTAPALHSFDKATNDWRTINWQSYEEQVRKLAGWLKLNGINPGDRVAIMSPNRPEWIIADLAILAVGAISVPIYATSAAKDVAFILEHSAAKALFVDNLDRIKGIGNTLPKQIVEFDKFADVLKSSASPITQTTPVQADDLATIIYTSGTTGVPKGVMHSHGALMATSPVILMVTGGGSAGTDRYFSFLPLSHVAERILVQLGSITTTSEVAFARSVDTLLEDLERFRPTILLCVPRLWEKIYERINAGIKTASPVKKAVFNLALRLGASRIEGNRILRANDASLGAKLSDALVGKKLRAKLGMDRVRMFLTGSAPTRPEVLRFFGSFGIFIREVYGLTENLCLGVYTPADVITIGVCGGKFPGCEIKIGDDGEIFFRSPYIFKGYYHNEAATKESLSADGWFATGDLGVLDANGSLKITGRKKELLKTSNGKYVAPVPIEDALKRLTIVTDAMMVGDNQKYCVALVAIDKEHLQDANAEQLLVDHLKNINSGLANHESIVRIGIMRAGFSVESGTLTPTLKLKRKAAVEQYAGFISRIYSADTPVVHE